MGGLAPAFEALIDAIVVGDDGLVATLLAESPDLALEAAAVGAERSNAETFFYAGIGHYLYRGDTALHLAAAAYRVQSCRDLIAHGAHAGAANRRGAQPLHYAADGNPNAATWDPSAQGATVTLLIEAGADPDALDRSGVAPLHRAVRTRSTGAVAALLAGGADPTLPNKSGSTPLALARQTTGRGGSGSPEAKAQQAAIIGLLTPS